MISDFERVKPYLQTTDVEIRDLHFHHALNLTGRSFGSILIEMCTQGMAAQARYTSDTRDELHRISDA